MGIQASQNSAQQVQQKSSSYKMDYKWTNKTWNSTDTTSKIARYSIIGIALIALVETIIEAVKVPCNFIANQFQSQKKVSSDTLKKASKIEEHKLPNKFTWKKALKYAVCVLGVGLVLWGGYETISFINGMKAAKIKDQKRIKEALDTMECTPRPKMCQKPSMFQANSGKPFVERFEAQKQCPSVASFIQDQKEKGYWGWTKDNMQRLFGKERDMSLEESRLGFYHGEMQKNIPSIIASHPDNADCIPLEKLPKKVTQDMSALRDTARDYTRERSYEFAQKWLEKHEPRDKGFEHYWTKYDQNPRKVIEGTMRSNPMYDSPKVLRVMDRVIPNIPKWLQSYLV